MKRSKSIFMAAFAVLAAVACIMPTHPVSAQSSAALSIVPKKNYTIEPGKSVKDKLTIRNLDSESPLILNLRVVDFTYTDDGGTPKLMLAEDAPLTTWSLKPFLTVPKSVTIPAKSSKTLDMSVSIPSKGGAGSYYSAIVYSAGSSEGGNVGLSASGVTLVFASIPGKVNEDLKLDKLGAYKLAKGADKADYVFTTTEEPQNVAYTLKNNGNVTEAPVGSITLKDMFGKERVISDVNPNASLALIGQTRTYTACIKLATQSIELDGTKSQAKTCDSPGLWPGYYSVSADLFYGQNGNNTQEIVSKSSFWYLPLWFIIVFVLVVLVAAFYIRKLVINIRARLYGPQVKKPSRIRK
ncbi:MAG: hypothetical protein JWP06_1022 [Candidatus Saccharibacteria bacterium]|nr:hypothetical protein [Candidatus Saccharibacteria bacterium]